ncbi:MAG: DUF11 domain-containing protein, partial [Pirellulaceae bacterium]|nr:DUF11 domain-containing protein [Pirellulaceae bacterium]
QIVNTDQLGIVTLPTVGSPSGQRPALNAPDGLFTLNAEQNTQISNVTIDNTGPGIRAGIFTGPGTLNVNRTDITGGLVGIDIFNPAGTLTFTDVTVNDPTDAGIQINGGSGLVLFDNSGINNSSGGTAVRVTGGHNGQLIFNPGTSITSTSGDGLQFDDADGTYNFNGTTTLNGGDAGIDILGGSAGTFTFTDTTITDPTGTGIEITGGSSTFTFGGTSNLNKSTGGSTLHVQGGHTGIVIFEPGTGLSATGTGAGDGLQFDDADGMYDFRGQVQLNGGDAGIDILGDSAGTFTFTDTTITNPVGTGIDITGGSSTITFDGLSSVTKDNSGSTVRVQGGHDGTITFNPNTGISASGAGAGDGLQFDDADGTYDFGGTVTLNGGDAGIDILSDSAGTFTFSDTTSITNTTPSNAGINIDNFGAGQFDFAGNIVGASGGGELVRIDTTAAGSTINFNNSGANSIVGNGAGNVTIFDADGTVAFTVPITIQDPSNSFLLTGISIFGGSGDINFAATDIVLPNDGFNTGVEINSHSGSITFDDLTIDVNGSGTPGNGMTGLSVFNAGTINITGNNSIDITGGPGIELNGANTIDMTFGSITATNSQDGFGGGSGITLTNVGGGTFDVTGTTTVDGANGAAGIGINIDDSVGTFTFASIDINNTTLEGIAIGSLSGNPGTVNINGGTVSNPGRNGARVNNAGRVNLTNTTINGSTDRAAVNITASSGTSFITSANGTFAVPGGNADGVEITTSDTSILCLHSTGSDATGSGTGFGLDLIQTGTSTLGITQADLTDFQNDNTGTGSLNTTGTISFNCAIPNGTPLLSDAASSVIASQSAIDPSSDHVAEPTGTVIDTTTSISDPPRPNRTTESNEATEGTVDALGDVEVVSMLDASMLSTIVDAALHRWAATGLDVSQIAALNAIEFSLANLPGWYLASTNGNSVQIDIDGGDQGWFIDPTPMDDSEVGNGSAAGMDLLTTVMHEMGHVLGLPDTYDHDDAGDLMFGFLALGSRRSPHIDRADGAVAGSITSTSFIGTPIDIGTLPAGKGVTITFDASVNSPLPQSVMQVSNQGLISGSNFDAINTDDPDTPAIDDPTVTPIDNVTATCSTIVTTTLDVVDPADGVTSLREAIICSNTEPGVQTISFAIAGTGVQKIQPASALPSIIDTVVIRGFTQTGATANTAAIDQSIDAVYQIELDGSLATSSFSVLNLADGSSGSTVQGLVINGFTGPAIRIADSHDNIISGNFIGTDALGATALGNSLGILIVNGNDNLIGGTTPDARNVVSGNSGSGIEIVASAGSTATGNRIQGNFIGTTKAGTMAAANDGHGILILASTANLIGGDTVAARNVISGNLGSGVELQDNAANNQVFGNFIGTDLTGNAEIANSEYGVGLYNAQDNLIGDATTTVGTGRGNVISGNRESGVDIDSGSIAIGDPSTGNIVRGNIIGLNAAGTAGLGNDEQGVAIINSSNNTIGGPDPDDGNLISGNFLEGVLIASQNVGTAADAGSGFNLVQNNSIGIDIAGDDQGNSQAGVVISDAISNTIADNRIAFNSTQSESTGIEVLSGTGNVFLRNSIFDNPGLGIDLQSDGVTPNDLGDTDVGANNLQNYPMLTSATTDTSTVVRGELNSLPNQSYRIEYFANPVADDSGFGEGKSFLGFENVTTDSAGTAPIIFTSPSLVPAGQFITSTATLLQVNGTETFVETSEFSNAVLVDGVVIPQADLSLTKSVDASTATEGQTVTFTVTLTNSGPDAATNISVADGIPAGLSNPTATPTTGAFSNGIWTIASLASDEVATLTVTGQVAAGATLINNTAELIAVDQADPDSTPNNQNPAEDDQDSASVTVTTVPTADLSLIKTVSTATATEGQTVTFTVTLNNAGPDAATNIAVSDTLPPGLSNATGTPTTGTFANGVWTIASLASGANATLTVVGQVAAGATVINNTAELIAVDQADPDSTPNNQNPAEDDQDSASIAISAPPQQVADLSLVKTVNNDRATIGQDIVYTIQLTNSGPNNATNVSVLDRLPTGLNFVRSVPNVGTYNDRTGIWTVGNLNVGQTVGLQIVATVNTNQPISNSAEVLSSDQFDPDSTPGNNVDGEDDQSAADIGACLTGGPLQAGPNRLTYSCVTPGGFAGFVVGTQLGSHFFDKYGVTVDIADPSVPAIGLGNINGVATVLVELTAAQVQQDLIFQAFEMLPTPSVSNTLFLSNVQERFDINASGEVSPLDALLIINKLADDAFAAQGETPLAADLKYDVNGDGTVSPQDLIAVLNWLSDQADFGNGEEASSAIDSLADFSTSEADELDDDLLQQLADDQVGLTF